MHRRPIGIVVPSRTDPARWVFCLLLSTIPFGGACGAEPSPGAGAAASDSHRDDVASGSGARGGEPQNGGDGEVQEPPDVPAGIDIPGGATGGSPELDDFGSLEGVCAERGHGTRCDGEHLTVCAGGPRPAVRRINCKQQGGVCGLDPTTGEHACLPAVQPCGAETAAGRCEGSALVFCAAGRVQRVDCAATQGRCETHGSYSSCVADPKRCKGETEAGRCDGDWLIWCDEQGIGEYDCASIGRRCVAADGLGEAGCELPPP